MPMTTLLIHFIAGMFLANAIPHVVHGISGHRFQTPFSRPPGKADSPPLVNVLWGAFNLAVGWHLVHYGRDAGPRPLDDQLAIGLGGLLVALLLAWWFGKVRGHGADGDTLG